MKTFKVAVSREGSYWVAVVEGVRGGATESRTLGNLEAEVIDLLAGLLDLDEKDVTVDMDFAPALGDDAQQAKELAKVSADLELLKRRYEDVQQHLVRSLSNKGISSRDSAKLAHVSHQRISQLLKS